MYVATWLPWQTTILRAGHFTLLLYNYRTQKKKKKNVSSGLFHLCANIDAFRFVWGICPQHKHLLAIQMCPAMYSMFYLL